MLISRTVTIKSRVTSALRTQLGVEAQKAIREFDGQLAQIEQFLQGESSGEDDVIRFKRQKQELITRKEEMLESLRNIAKLQDGQEIVSGQIQGFYDLRVGDLWPNVLDCEVVLEDGRVLAIREGANVTVSLDLQTEEQPEKHEESREY